MVQTITVGRSTGVLIVCPIGYRTLGYPQHTVLRLWSLPNLPLYLPLPLKKKKKKKINVKSSPVVIFFLIC